jgi:hypothetical protein
MFDDEKAEVTVPAQNSRCENAGGAIIRQACNEAKAATVNKPTSRWQDAKVVTFHGQYDTKIKTGEDYERSTLGDIIGGMPTSKPKAKAPAFIPSSYYYFDAREHAVQRSEGMFVALVGDIDKGNVPMADITAYTRTLFGSEAAIFIYSTGSATPEDRRWRIIIPLFEPVPFERWNVGQEAFFGYMESNGVPMDRSLARSAQPVYLPNVPPNRRNANGSPLFYQFHLEGEEGVAL